MRLTFIALFSLIFSCSCVINKPIKYATDNIAQSSNYNLKSLNFTIVDFEDKRKEVKENLILFEKTRNCRVNKQHICINSEFHYHKEPVNKQITNQLIEHLRQRKTFKSVTLNNKDSADYYMTGNLRCFFSIEEYSDQAVAAAIILGPLASIGFKTGGIVAIELTDLKIFDKNNKLIKQIDSFRRDYEFEANADIDCWSVFNNANLKLKDYFDDFIINIEDEILNASNQNH